MNYLYLGLATLVAGALCYGAHSHQNAEETRRAAAASARQAAAKRRRARKQAAAARADAERRDQERLDHAIAATVQAATQAGDGHMARLDRQKRRQPMWSTRRREMARLRGQLQRRADELAQLDLA